jgi:phage pi2 protein 07
MQKTVQFLHKLCTKRNLTSIKSWFWKPRAETNRIDLCCAHFARDQENQQLKEEIHSIWWFVQEDQYKNQFRWKMKHFLFGAKKISNNTIEIHTKMSNMGFVHPINNWTNMWTSLTNSLKKYLESHWTNRFCGQANSFPSKQKCRLMMARKFNSISELILKNDNTLENVREILLQST